MYFFSIYIFIIPVTNATNALTKIADELGYNIENDEINSYFINYQETIKRINAIVEPISCQQIVENLFMQENGRNKIVDFIIAKGFIMRYGDETLIEFIQKVEDAFKYNCFRAEINNDYDLIIINEIQFAVNKTNEFINITCLIKTADTENKTIPYDTVPKWVKSNPIKKILGSNSCITITRGLRLTKGIYIPKNVAWYMTTRIGINLEDMDL